MWQQLVHAKQQLKQSIWLFLVFWLFFSVKTPGLKRKVLHIILFAVLHSPCALGLSIEKIFNLFLIPVSDGLFKSPLLFTEAYLSSNTFSQIYAHVKQSSISDRWRQRLRRSAGKFKGFLGFPCTTSRCKHTAYCSAQFEPIVQLSFVLFAFIFTYLSMRY